MAVSAEQIAKAKAKGLINVEALAVACDKFKFPFYLACTIMERETGGQNIFGHDAGGSFSGPITVKIAVTEERYKTFLVQLAAGKASNGVGPMQLTYRGYHLGPQSLTSRGFKAWVPAGNILYGVEILSKSLKTQLATGLPLAKAFWNVAKIYNAGKLDGPAGVDYANGAAASAKTWAATVGTADLEVTPVSGLAISSKMHANARGVTKEVLGRFPAIKQIWTHADFPDHNNDRCTDFMVTGLGLTRAQEVAFGDAIAGYLIKNADRIGLNWLIWNRRIYRHQNTDRGHGWADYTGPKPHTDHVHQEVDDRTYKPPEDDMPTAKEIIDELIKRGPQVGAAIAKGYLSADDIIPAGKDETNAANTHQVPATFITGDHDLLVDIREALKNLAPPTT